MNGWSRRIFRLLLLVYPAHVRNTHGADMWITFEHHLHDARLRGRFAVVDLWRREILAAWRSGRHTRLPTRRPAQTQRRRHRISSRLEAWFGISTLDFKLGLRMLVKYPGLTIVGGLGMATAIAIGVGFFGFVDSFSDTRLPFEEGDRLVTIQSWDVERSREHEQVLNDAIRWREEARAIEDIGAAMRVPGRNLITEDGHVELVRLAVISASAFRVTRVPPLLGRTLLDPDESLGAPPVAVIGYNVWQDVFASNPDAIGKRLRIGNTEHTVVGVMPEGFGFPYNEEAWTPLRLDPSQYEWGGGPPLVTFGRLADDATIADARAELLAIGERIAAAHPETHARLRPRVLSYTMPFVDMDDPQAYWLLRLARMMMSLVLVIVCMNVAILVYARTAMRQREIGVRTALGATRGRVVTQLFVEAFVLSVGAAVVGVLAADVALRKIDAFWRGAVGEQTRPFWLDVDLSPGAIIYAVGLTILAGVIVGVVPGLKATGRDVHNNLQRLGGGGTRGSLGGTWTFLIVTQVAVAVAGLPIAGFHTWRVVRSLEVDPGFNADEYLTARVVLETDSLQGVAPRVEIDRAGSPHGTSLAELVRRLEGDPLINAVTYSRHGVRVGGGATIEVDGLVIPESRGHFVYSNDVDIHFFRTFNVPLLGGRALVAGDLTGGESVMVNRSFAEKILEGGNPVGRRVTYVRGGRRMTEDSAETRWYEIVGLVNDMTHNPNFSSAPATVYHPIAPSELNSAILEVRMRGAETANVATRLREAGAAVDPTMRLYEIRSKGDEIRQERRAILGLAFVVYVAMLCVILLSSAGIYALMSFTVTQRRREIGIRTALGGQPHQILAGIFTQAATQVTAGVTIGVALPLLVEFATEGFVFEGRGLTVLSIAALVMMTVGVTAALGPARQGLRVQPTEALQDAD